MRKIMIMIILCLALVGCQADNSFTKNGDASFGVIDGTSYQNEYLGMSFEVSSDCTISHFRAASNYTTTEQINEAAEGFSFPLVEVSSEDDNSMSIIMMKASENIDTIDKYYEVINQSKLYSELETVSFAGKEFYSFEKTTASGIHKVLLIKGDGSWLNISFSLTGDNGQTFYDDMSKSITIK